MLCLKLFSIECDALESNKTVAGTELTGNVPSTTTGVS
jgi:hypothetical protein